MARPDSRPYWLDLLHLDNVEKVREYMWGRPDRSGERPTRARPLPHDLDWHVIHGHPDAAPTLTIVGDAHDVFAVIEDGGQLLINPNLSVDVIDDAFTLYPQLPGPSRALLQHLRQLYAARHPRSTPSAPPPKE